MDPRDKCDFTTACEHSFLLWVSSLVSWELGGEVLGSLLTMMAVPMTFIAVVCGLSLLIPRGRRTG